MLDYLTGKPRLSSGRAALGQFSVTKQLGASLRLTWPCTNSGDADGVAFIKVREPSSALVWDGAPFPVPVGQTALVNLQQTVDLPLGLRSLVPELHEGLPPDGVGLIASDTLALTVVSVAILAPVGLPRINNLDGPTFFSVVGATAIIPVSWPCQNSGGAPRSAQLIVQSGGSADAVGNFVIVPGLSTVTLLVSFSNRALLGGVRDSVVIMAASNPFEFLGQFQFSYTRIA